MNSARFFCEKKKHSEILFCSMQNICFCQKQNSSLIVKIDLIITLKLYLKIFTDKYPFEKFADKITFFTRIYWEKNDGKRIIEQKKGKLKLICRLDSDDTSFF